MISKKELRKEILKRRDELSLAEREIKSHKIAQQVICLEEFIKADKLLLYASYKSEVITDEIFETAKEFGKEVYYPKVCGDEMEFYHIQKDAELLEGYRGIREPEATQQKRFQPVVEDRILIILPGAVFDVERNRIGYGGGYYDKYLQKLQTRGPQENVAKIALAFECQMVEEGQIASEEHDIKPDCLITERKMIRMESC